MAPFEGVFTIVVTHWIQPVFDIWQLTANGPQIPYNLVGGVSLETENEFLSSAFTDNNIFFTEAEALAKATEMLEKTKAVQIIIDEIDLT